MKAKLTQRFLETRKPPASGRIDYYDELMRGLVVRHSASGVMSFSFMYFFAGKRQRLTLGKTTVLSLAEARDQARIAAAQVAQGYDPANIKRERRAAEVAKRAELKAARIASTERAFERIVAEFYEHMQRRGKPSARQFRDILRRYGKEWLDTDISAITPAMIEKRIRRLETDKPAAARKFYTVAGTFFRYTQERRLIEALPVARYMAPAVGAPRSRVLSEDEIRTVWAASQEFAVSGAVVRFLLATGQRKSEVVEMPRPELDIEGRAWTIPAERTKNGRTHRVPLSDLALDILNGLPESRNQYVFGSPTGTSPIANWSRFLKTLRERCEGVDAFTLHDLRRTAATHLNGRLRFSEVDVALVLNHASGSVTQRHYIQWQDEARKAECLNAWGAELVRIIENRESRGEVLPFNAALP